MTPEEAKLCRTGRDPERPSVVFMDHLFVRDKKPVTTCQRCGYADLPPELQAKVEAKSAENAAAQKRRDERNR